MFLYEIEEETECLCGQRVFSELDANIISFFREKTGNQMPDITLFGTISRFFDQMFRGRVGLIRGGHKDIMYQGLIDRNAGILDDFLGRRAVDFRDNDDFVGRNGGNLAFQFVERNGCNHTGCLIFVNGRFAGENIDGGGADNENITCRFSQTFDPDGHDMIGGACSCRLVIGNKCAGRIDLRQFACNLFVGFVLIINDGGVSHIGQFL